ncbi:hypothetical protein F5884DRAFT_281767 [Xylogone sp. PMI_703]|nr:hypothetical protein F5884DRAFT_281767 [Xylogone sp. PMI_703]
MASSSPQPNSPRSPIPESARQVAEARAALEASMNNIGSSLDANLRSRAQNLHANAAVLDKQQKDLVKATDGLKKETEKLRKLASEGSRKVKELGDVQNWAEMLERDFLVLEETLRLVEEGSEGDSEWSTETDSDFDEDHDRPGETGHDSVSVADPPAPDPISVPNTTEDGTSKDQDGDTTMKDTNQLGKEGTDFEAAQPHVEAQDVPGGSSTTTNVSSSEPSGSASASIGS